MVLEGDMCMESSGDFQPFPLFPRERKGLCYDRLTVSHIFCRNRVFALCATFLAYSRRRGAVSHVMLGASMKRKGARIRVG